MIKSFVFSFLIAAGFLSLVVATEGFVLADDKASVEEGQEFALIKDESITLASEEGEENDSSDYTLLLGKDGSVADTATTTVDITITDPNYSYEY